jgi:hypothetical protein
LELAQQTKCGRGAGRRLAERLLEVLCTLADTDRGLFIRARSTDSAVFQFHSKILLRKIRAASVFLTPHTQSGWLRYSLTEDGSLLSGFMRHDEEFCQTINSLITALRNPLPPIQSASYMGITPNVELIVRNVGSLEQVYQDSEQMRQLASQLDADVFDLRNELELIHNEDHPINSRESAVWNEMVEEKRSFFISCFCCFRPKRLLKKKTKMRKFTPSLQEKLLVDTVKS